MLSGAHDDWLRVEDLRVRLRAELPPGQARIAYALLLDGPMFEPPERPVTLSVIADGLGLSVNTVRTHLRRVRLGHPTLWAAIREERRRRLATYHEAAVEGARERSLRWGRRRYAARFRREHGRWPWEVYAERRRSGRPG